MDGLANERPVLMLESKEPILLPPICVSCGEQTTLTTRIDVGAGDTATELKKALVHATGVITLNSVEVPCCRRCRGFLTRKTLLAASLFFSGLGLFALVPILSSIFGRLPEMVWIALTFVGFMVALFGPILVYTRARNRTIPVHVFLISGPAYRYIFFSHLYSDAVRKSENQIEPHPTQSVPLRR